jgi:hypothetical protein
MTSEAATVVFGLAAAGFIAVVWMARAEQRRERRRLQRHVGLDGTVYRLVGAAPPGPRLGNNAGGDGGPAGCGGDASDD